MNLELNDGQVDLLREVLDGDLRELRSEVSHTDNHRYRSSLKERETLLRSILDLVGGPLPAAR